MALRRSCCVSPPQVPYFSRFSRAAVLQASITGQRAHIPRASCSIPRSWEKNHSISTSGWAQAACSRKWRSNGVRFGRSCWPGQ